MAAFAALAGAIVVIDVATKAAARSSIGAPEELIVGFRLELNYNEGIAFGLFSGVPSAVLIAVGVGLTAAVALAVWRGLVDWIPAALLAGGAIANLVDRAHDGAVTDFIDPPSWPAFNFADAAITLGVLALVWSLLSSGDRASRPVAPRRAV